MIENNYNSVLGWKRSLLLLLKYVNFSLLPGVYLSCQHVWTEEKWMKKCLCHLRVYNHHRSRFCFEKTAASLGQRNVWSKGNVYFPFQSCQRKIILSDGSFFTHTQVSNELKVIVGWPELERYLRRVLDDGSKQLTRMFGLYFHYKRLFKEWYIETRKCLTW